MRKLWILKSHWAFGRLVGKHAQVAFRQGEICRWTAQLSQGHKKRKTEVARYTQFLVDHDLICLCIYVSISASPL